MDPNATHKDAGTVNCTLLLIRTLLENQMLVNWNEWQVHQGTGAGWGGAGNKSPHRKWSPQQKSSSSKKKLKIPNE